MDLPQGGIEVPCILIFKSQSIKECSKTEHLIKSAKSISSEALSTIASIDPCEGNIKQSEGGEEACARTSTVKSKSSSPIKASHLSADDVIEMLTSDEDKAEPPAKKLRCTIHLCRTSNHGSKT